MDNRFGVILTSIGIALIFQVLVVIGYNISNGEGAIGRVLLLLGGELPFGIIQFLTYFLFLFGMLEIRSQSKKISLEDEAFAFRLLPEKENWVLNPDDVAQIKMTASNKSKQHKYILLDLISKVCTKYRSDRSSSDALDMLAAQTRINLSMSESEQSLIRYTAWAIPSVGFIGTIIGIANSLGFASEATTPEGIGKVTAALNIAFDTTLVSLFLSLGLMLSYHLFQERVQKTHTRMEQYVMDNLINRIYYR